MVDHSVFHEKISSSRAAIMSGPKDLPAVVNEVEREILPFLTEFVTAAKFGGFEAVISDSIKDSNLDSLYYPVGPALIYKSRCGNNWSLRLMYRVISMNFCVLSECIDTNDENKITFSDKVTLKAASKEGVVNEFFDILSDIVGRIQGAHILSENRKDLRTDTAHRLYHILIRIIFPFLSYTLFVSYATIVLSAIFEWGDKFFDVNKVYCFLFAGSIFLNLLSRLYLSVRYKLKFSLLR